MKKTGLIYLFVALLGISFVACEDTNGDKLPNVSFSEVQGLDMTLLENTDTITGFFTLDVQAKWTVSSDQMMWVAFSKSLDGEYYADISGNAGQDTVYVRMTNAGRDHNDVNANIMLYVADQEYLVSTIMRSGEKWKVEEIEIGYSATASVDFGTVYDIEIKSWPEWLMEPVYDTNGYTFTVVDSMEFLQNPLDGQLVICDNTLNIERYIPVKYLGMDSVSMQILGDSPWNWLVSIDGKELKSKQAMDSVVIKECLEMNVVCRNDAYSIFFAEEAESRLYPKTDNEVWIKASHSGIDSTALSITVDASEQGLSRTGYLFAVPEAVCDSFEIELALCDSTNNIIDKYENYVLAQIEQRAAGFEVALLENDVETAIACEVDEEADYYVIIASNYFNGTDPDVSACDVELGKSYVINTKLTAESWSEKNIAMFDMMDSKLDIRLGSWVPNKKGILGEDGFYRIYITVPESLVIDEEYPDVKYSNYIVMRLYSSDQTNMKALLFRVQE